MALVPVRGADGGTYTLEYVTGAGGGLVPGVPLEPDQISQGGLTTSGSSQQLVAANASRTFLRVSNSGDSDVWLTFHASNSAVAGQGTLLPGRAQGTYFTESRVAVINETSGANCVVGYAEF